MSVYSTNTIFVIQNVEIRNEESTLDQRNSSYRRNDKDVIFYGLRQNTDIQNTF